MKLETLTSQFRKLSIFFLNIFIFFRKTPFIIDAQQFRSRIDPISGQFKSQRHLLFLVCTHLMLRTEFPAQRTNPENVFVATSFGSHCGYKYHFGFSATMDYSKCRQFSHSILSKIFVILLFKKSNLFPKIQLYEKIQFFPIFSLN